MHHPAHFAITIQKHCELHFLEPGQNREWFLPLHPSLRTGERQARAVNLKVEKGIPLGKFVSRFLCEAAIGPGHFSTDFKLRVLAQLLHSSDIKGFAGSYTFDAVEVRDLLESGRGQNEIVKCVPKQRIGVIGVATNCDSLRAA